MLLHESIVFGVLYVIGCYHALLPIKSSQHMMFILCTPADATTKLRHARCDRCCSHRCSNCIWNITHNNSAIALLAHLINISMHTPCYMQSQCLLGRVRRPEMFVDGAWPYRTMAQSLSLQHQPYIYTPKTLDPKACNVQARCDNIYNSRLGLRV